MDSGVKLQKVSHHASYHIETCALHILRIDLRAGALVKRTQKCPLLSGTQKPGHIAHSGLLTVSLTGPA
jgi:hypothetical protein